MWYYIQLIGLQTHFDVDMDLFLEHVAVLIYITAIYLKVVTSILSENKVILQILMA